ncbi:MAG: hypothetical protein MJZ46_06600 [Bacteroidales bacterium]|nr:hypothetical protein [Bacteroidales bacterium]
MSEHGAKLAWTLLNEKEKEDKVFMGGRRLGGVALRNKLHRITKNILNHCISEEIFIILPQTFVKRSVSINPKNK